MKGQCVAAFGLARPRPCITGEGDLLTAEASLVADHSAGATLALEAVAHGYARWLALDGEVKLAAAAGGVSGGHALAPVTVDTAECRPELRMMQVPKNPKHKKNF
jgi:hypothetical protein